MARFIDVLAAAFAVGSAVMLYNVSYETRRLEARIQARERLAEKLESDIAVLKAERAYLARPERIEELARRQGLEPIRERQYLRLGQPFEDPIARMLDRSDTEPSESRSSRR